VIRHHRRIAWATILISPNPYSIYLGQGRGDSDVDARRVDASGPSACTRRGVVLGTRRRAAD